MMRQTWRWFGPADTIALSDLLQVGVEGVVSALHHIENGAIWSPEDIRQRQRDIEYFSDGRRSGLTWDVVESLPVSEAIKTKSERHRDHIAHYCTSLENLAAAGIQTVCYNFMPILDWTRTQLAAPLPSGARAMAFDLIDFIAFDTFLLKRRGAEDDYDAELIERAKQRFAMMDDAAKAALQKTIVAGLPGANKGWTMDSLKDQLETYATIGAAQLRQNLIDFLAEVIPTAEKHGIRLCCHPDDPPFPLLGLPRIMSTEDDFRQILEAIDHPSNGITFCTGSLGVRPEFDAPGFVERLGDRIHFAHLRNTRRSPPADGPRTSFFEAEHLNGDTDMVATIKALLAEQARRKKIGRSDWQIPMRPDHGQDLLYDQKQQSMPGYPLIGRMRGLAELRGVMTALA